MTTAPRASTRGCCPTAKAPSSWTRAARTARSSTASWSANAGSSRGDVVTIGANSFVFGREIPSARQLDQTRQARRATGPAAPGEHDGHPARVVPRAPVAPGARAPGRDPRMPWRRRRSRRRMPAESTSPSRSNSNRTPPSWTGSSAVARSPGCSRTSWKRGRRARAASRRTARHPGAAARARCPARRISGGVDLHRHRHSARADPRPRPGGAGDLRAAGRRRARRRAAPVAAGFTGHARQAANAVRPAGRADDEDHRAELSMNAHDNV